MNAPCDDQVLERESCVQDILDGGEAFGSPRIASRELSLDTRRDWDNCTVHVAMHETGGMVVYEKLAPGGSTDRAYLYLLDSVDSPGDAPVSCEAARIDGGEKYQANSIFQSLSDIFRSASTLGGSRDVVRYLALAMRACATQQGDLNRASPYGPRGGLSPFQMRTAQALLICNDGEKLSISEVAMACGLSLAHFSRAFRISTGVPPYRWVLDRRLDHAKNLLARTTLSLVDIADDCGFSAQSHFTRVFTKRFGVSPGAWRRACFAPSTRASSIG